MRKIQFLLATWMFAIVTCGAMPAYAQAQAQTQVPTKAQTKAAEKAGKARAKALKKEGWMTDSAEPLEIIIMHHLLKTDNYGGTGEEYVGNAQAVKNITLGGRMARSDARTQYEQAEAFVATYETMVMQEFDGDLRQSYTIYRPMKDGKYEVRVYFWLDADRASQARIKALQHAAAEAKLSQEVADSMSKFIKDGFKKETPAN